MEMPALSVAGAARGLGVAPATLRSWERRYGLVPSLHTVGGHRRYGPADLARLQVMHRLVREGVPPGEAAKVAIRARVEDLELSGGPYAALLTGMSSAAASAARASREGASGELASGDLPVGDVPSGDAPSGRRLDRADREPLSSASPSAGTDSAGPTSSGGGRVLALPKAARTVKGLARAAMALDSYSCQRAVTAALATSGAIDTWDRLVRPVLAASGDRWERTGRGVEIEHSFSVIVAGAFAAHAARLARPSNDRPILLASVPGELHDLPLLALHAALADGGMRSHVAGAAMPEEALADAVERLGPPVVFLWSQMGIPLLPTLPALRPAPMLVLGGPGWREVPERAVLVKDLAGAVDAIRQLTGIASGTG